MDRQKYLLRVLGMAALAVLSTAVSDKLFAQGMGPGGMMEGGMMGDGSTTMRTHGGVSWPDTLEVVTVSGVVSLEENYFHDRYTLDVDADGNADYQISFGPWWYEPENGATRPADGASVSIKGGVYPAFDDLPLLIAFEVDDSPWRDPGELLPWSGGWMHGSADTTFFHAAQDSLSWMGFPAGAMDDLRNHMVEVMGSDIASDSAYFHFKTVDPDSMVAWMDMPGMMNATMVAGYHLGFSDPWGNDLMGDEMGMSFDHDIDMHLHYDAYGAGMEDPSGHDLTLMSLDGNLEWTEVPGATVDMDEEMVSSTSRQISGYYAVVARSVPSTAVEGQTRDQTPSTIALFPNYPNPFNSSTTISYNLPRNEWVTLEILNNLGQSVRKLVHGPQGAGHATVHWDGKDDAGRKLASGVYLYRLQSGEQVQMRRLLLLQ